MGSEDGLAELSPRTRRAVETALARAETEQALHLTEEEQYKMSTASLYIPGDIVHIYQDSGQYKAAKVPRSFSSFSRIELQHNMLKDHKGTQMFGALHGVKCAMDAKVEPPRWQAYSDAKFCACCDSNFTWNSTLDSKAQQMRDRFNCRHCGLVVCDSCSMHRVPIFSIGIAEPVRVCDRCRWNISGFEQAGVLSPCSRGVPIPNTTFSFNKDPQEGNHESML